MSTSVGYKTATYDLHELKAMCPERGVVDTSLQSIHSADGGLMLHTSELSAIRNAPEENPIIVLTYSYVPSSENSATTPVMVNQARLDAVRFVDYELQEKYGHLFDQALIEERRAAMRMDRLSDLEPPKRYLVLRAMDSDCKHLLPMDYCYISDSFAVDSLAKRVLKCYENEELPRTVMERALLNTLNHAVTCAVYNGTSQHVTSAVVQNNKLFKARNDGEFFYDGDAPVKVKSLLLVNEHGEVSLALRKNDLESIRQFS